MIGRQLGGRYEILGRIGGGGMALVYKAHDILLNRYVAVKVLRQQYVNDEEFIRRFRREAQSAASLSHPNIVSIYDVGQELEVHYIVMEYVEGVTLNDVIKERAPLQVEEAVHFASQICDALDHAHVNQIIHRDIKPHNILIGKNGRVKVTDFGIARATSSSSITQTGSVVGSVHYFSPEHAKGTTTGAKSDLYSLGIVLYQMLTAKLPFIGDSPISVALKHLQESIVDPRKVNALIPQSVENIILKAVRKNEQERYQSAKEMLIDLETCLTVLRRNEAKVVFLNLDEHDDEKTRVIPAIRVSSNPNTAKNASTNYTPIADAVEEANKKNYWIGPLVWFIIFLVTIGVLWYVVLPMIKDSGAPKDVDVPNVIGMLKVDAEDMLTKAGFKPIEKLQASTEIPLDTIINQDPKGMKVKEGANITLFISSGIEKAKVENYKGRKISEVVAELTDLGLDPETQIITDLQFLTEEKDTIVNQDPPEGDEFDPKKVVYKFTVSQGSEKIAMPDLTGKTKQEAINILALQSLSLDKREKVGVIYKPSFQQPKDKIFDQFPLKPGEDIDPGMDKIVIWISTGDPADAGDMTTSVTLKPAKEGTSSTFRINLTDARNDNVDLKTIDVSETQIENIKVTVTKDTKAVVNIYRDNALYDTQNYTYQSYLDYTTLPTPTASPAPTIDGQSPSPTPIPGDPAASADPSPTPIPVISAGG
ncbi:Stk1 family PASTA domain-containing Ser/Thr kinase [Paenibacillus psychroresistens]|uniref:Serine/threonine-protein kinase PrkC n=1 Tax=Paenibacillus psychroresistens TaxID=1778678 RepID=A0A6B8RNN8_9BACL|nr:Stk1 family PASTA domain-containing Ser/Thr kinase [Paenibacillus psychroresistens]QGQ96938.1 Stk1 family PASTA domain-containing Ser/Thr kinase [Paenibacillus psychroresistens]